MTKLQWDQDGQRLYETGTSQGVLYPRGYSGYEKGVAWNGLTAVSESPSGAEATPLYADNTKYLNLVSAEEFGATIEAYTYPDEFEECDGSRNIAPGVSIGQQSRKTFGMAYKTEIGNDINDSYGYKLHIIYGALAAPSEKAYSTINDSPEAITFSWEVSTTPVNVTGGKPTANLVINSTKTDPVKLKKLEDILYGTESQDPRLPLPDEIKTIFGDESSSTLTMTIDPSSGSTNVANNKAIKLTFSNAIATEQVIITGSDHKVVDVTKSWDQDRKVITITPKANLKAGLSYNVIVSGVTDVYGNKLEGVVKYFTVAN